MKKFLAFSLLISLTLIFSGCQEDWREYVGKHFSIEYPNNWNLIENLENKRLLPENAILALAVLDSFSNKIASVNILKKKYEQTLSTEEYLARSITQVKSAAGYQEIEQRDINIQGYKTKLITFKISDAGTTNLYLQSYFYNQAEQTGYTVTATLDENASEGVIEQTTKIIKSFKFNQ